MGTGRTKLLVVDPDPDRTRQLASWAPEEWSVGTARDGRAALRAVGEGVDLVVLSLSLPDRTGEGVLQEIHNRGYECQVIAVAEEERSVALADDVLVTPLERPETTAVLERAGDRVTYDERVREYFSLVSRLASMEARRSSDELADSEEYARLSERVRRIRNRVDELLEDASEEDFEDVFRGFFPGRAAR